MVETRVDVREEPASAHWNEPDKAVVVAVDGSERNRAAVAWAASEAAAAGRPLDLVHVLDERDVPSPFHRLETDDQHAWRLLDEVEAELRERYPQALVRKAVTVGPVATCLVDRSAEQSALVVGRRGLGRFVRLLIGSTSLDVASRARVPAVVVPDPWSAEGHRSDAVVVGVDLRDVQTAVLWFAFAAARLRDVPLVAAHGRDLPAVGWDSSGCGRSWESDTPGPESREDLEQLLKPYCEAFPAVEVSVIDRPGHPLSVLLDEAGPTQLLVLGRHSDRHSDRQREGFPFGSVAHGVLYYAQVPVAIVPPSR